MVSDNLLEEDHPLYGFQTSNALDKLINILQTQTIHASPMPFVLANPPAVCFTECLWDALTKLADAYSPYGVVFSKKLIYDKGGGPVLYLRGNVLKQIGSNLPSLLGPFVMPFDPDAVLKRGVRLDYLHEREWRLPSSLQFEYSDIEYVIVDTIKDAQMVVHEIGAQHLPEERLIPIEVYRTIRKAWREI